MPKTEYELTGDRMQVLGSASDEIHFFIRHNSDSLTVPAASMVVNISEVVEQLDLNAGLIQMENVELHLSEQYGDYSNGFWNTILDDATLGDHELELRITYGGTSYDNTLFWGVLDPYASSEKEIFLSGSDYIRTARLVFVDMLSKLRDVRTQDLVTEVLLHDAPFTSELSGGTQLCIKVMDIIASMLVTAYGQTFSSSDVILVSNDIQYYDDTSSTWHDFDNVYVETFIGYFNPNDENNSIAHRYNNALEFLGAICQNFGLIARRVTHSSGKHQIELLTRGNAYATTMMMDSPEKESEMQVASREKPVYIHCGMENNVEDFAAWFDAVGVRSRRKPEVEDGIGFRNNTPNYNVIDSTNVPKMRTRNDMRMQRTAKEPLNISWDLMIDILWMSNDSVPRHTFTMPYVFASSVMRPVHQTRYYDYVSQEWSASEDFGQIALCKYYHYRFFPSRRMFTRKYVGLEATENSVKSFKHMRPLKRIQIDDGVRDSFYYAQRVAKNITTNEVTIDWVEE